ncbi:MAG: hypothetical protein PW734_08145 [Verrucomicrobium sp.]|nr:hypothetical protein [Verrucomicrobium sp.]
MQWLLPALALLFTLSARAETAGPLPDSAAVVEKVLARDELQQVDLERYQYRQRVRTEKLDSRGQVRSASELIMVVRPGQDGGFSIVADGSGAILAPDEAEDRSDEARASEKLKDTFSLRRLASRFDIRVAGQEECLGKPAYVLTFTPKPDKSFLPRSMTERVLGRVEGRMWVAQDDYTILRTEARLPKPVDLAWFFAVMKSFQFSYAAAPIPSGWGPGSFALEYRVDAVPFQHIRQRQQIAIDGYRLR